MNVFVFVIVFVIVIVFVFVFVIVFVFVFVIVFVFVLLSSPIQELEPGATPCRGGRYAARYPHGLPAASKQNTVDYDVVPADGVEPPQGRAGRGIG